MQTARVKLQQNNYLTLFHSINQFLDLTIYSSKYHNLSPTPADCLLSGTFIFSLLCKLSSLAVMKNREEEKFITNDKRRR